LVAQNSNVETFKLECGTNCFLPERSWLHIQFLHPNVDLKHIEEALLQFRSEWITPNCTAHIFYLDNSIGEDQLIITEPVTNYDEILNFKLRDQSSNKPVRVVPKPECITLTRFLAVCLIRKNQRNEVVTAFWKNPEIEMEYTSRFWANHAFVDSVNYCDEIILSLNQYRNL